MVKLSDGVMGHHHKQFSTQWVTEITQLLFVLLINTEHFIFKNFMWRAVHSSPLVDGAYHSHINVPLASLLLSRLGRVACSLWAAEGWGEKGLSLVLNVFQVCEQVRFH